VSIRRRLASAEPETHRLFLARSLQQVGLVSLRLHRLSDATGAIAEVVDLRRSDGGIDLASTIDGYLELCESTGQPPDDELVAAARGLLG
jgi:hypothetical protein